MLSVGGFSGLISAAAARDNGIAEADIRSIGLNNFMIILDIKTSSLLVTYLSSFYRFLNRFLIVE